MDQGMGQYEGTDAEMTIDRDTPHARPSDLEGTGTEQTWGQGEGRHEPTVPDDGEEAQPATYTGGEATELDDPDLPLAREDEGMDR